MCFRIRRNRDAINVGVCQAHSVHDNLAIFEDGVEFRLERGRLAVGIVVISVSAGSTGLEIEEWFRPIESAQVEIIATRGNNVGAPHDDSDIVPAVDVCGGRERAAVADLARTRIDFPARYKRSSVNGYVIVVKGNPVAALAAFPCRNQYRVRSRRHRAGCPVAGRVPRVIYAAQKHRRIVRGEKRTNSTLSYDLTIDFHAKTEVVCRSVRQTGQRFREGCIFGERSRQNFAVQEIDVPRGVGIGEDDRSAPFSQMAERRGQRGGR